MDEQTENQLETARKLSQLGYMDESHFREHREKVISGLRMFGGIFEKSLACCLDHGTDDDAIKILRYWQQLCDHASLI